MKRSPELKKALSQNLLETAKGKTIPSDEDVRRFTRSEMLREANLVSSERWSKDEWNRYRDEVEKILQRNRELLRLREEILQHAIELVSTLESQTDEDFEQHLSQVQKLLDDFANLKRAGQRESFTLSFVDIATVENFDQFIRGRWPMQFIPHKEEIGRILAVAQQVHGERVKRGEIQMSEPIKIVDIGGSNGALGKLMVDLARENGLEIHYITIDPDLTTIKAASEFYRDEMTLEFIAQTAEEYTSNLYAERPEIKTLIDFRRQRIQEGEQKIKELEVYLETIQSDYFKLKEEGEQRKAIGRHCRVLRDDFGIDLNPDSFPTLMAFDEVFEDEYVYDKYSDEILEKISYTQKYRDKLLQPPIEELTKQINCILAQTTPNADLTINSWMPPRMDLTSEIQFINSGAILYALERGGATGCQTNAAFPEKPKRPGDSESYRSVPNYRSSFGWVGHSTPQLRKMSDSRSRNIPFTERMIDRSENPRGIENTFPFSNAFVVQLRNDVAVGDINPKQVGIKVEGSYPWEQELDERGGTVQPIRFITDKDGTPDLSTIIP